MNCQNRAHYPPGEHALCAGEFHRCDGGPPGEAASYDTRLHVATETACERFSALLGNVNGRVDWYLGKNAAEPS